MEPACGAALVPVYENLFKSWKKEGRLQELKSALVVVCGGNMITLNQLRKWKEQLQMT